MPQLRKADLMGYSIIRSELIGDVFRRLLLTERRDAAWYAMLQPAKPEYFKY